MMMLGKWQRGRGQGAGGKGQGAGHNPSLGTRHSALALLRYAVLCIILLMLLGGAASSKPAAALDHNKIAQALNATVLVLVPDNSGDLVAGGSGTIMDAEQGYILTNFHVMGDKQKNELTNDQGLAFIGLMPPNLKGAPVIKYRAQFVNGDPELDLAVLKITALADDPRSPLPQNLGLTAIGRGDSEQLAIGDQLFVIGYPGLGGATVTMTSGLVSGFLDDNKDNVFEWIKTDAEVNHGNSGGLAVNADGDFIGVPSAGVADVEAAGKISLIRTGNLALSFYDSVLLGKAPNNVGNNSGQSSGKNSGAKGAKNTGPTSGAQPAGTAQITNVKFGETVNRRNEVIKPAVKFKGGIKQLYAAFDYDGFRDGQRLTYVWYYNGGENSRDNAVWDGGKSGKNWVNLTNDKGLPNGFYEVELLLDDESLYRGGVVVGATAKASCQFGPLTFASGLTQDNQPDHPGQTFSNIGAIYAFFDAQGMSNGTPWQRVWYIDNRKVHTDESVWEWGENSNQWISLTHPDGLPTGKYKLELYCDSKLAQSGQFTVAERTTEKNNEINVTGTVHDRDNKRQLIKGALVVFLNPGVVIDDWVNNNFPKEDVYASGTSNSKGEFQLSAKVTPGQSYGVVVVQDNYQSVAVDNYAIPEDASDPYELDVPMQRK